jgi:hypothetical protein
MNSNLPSAAETGGSISCQRERRIALLNWLGRCCDQIGQQVAAEKPMNAVNNLTQSIGRPACARVGQNALAF